MDNNDWEKLLKKYKLGQFSDDELKEIRSFFSEMEIENPNNFDIPQSVYDHWDKFENLEYFLTIQEAKKGKIKKIRRWSFSSAAVLLLVIGLTFFFLNNHKDSQRVLADILPGKDGGLLSLVSGKTIDLENIGDRNIDMDGIVSLTRKNGFIKYKLSSHSFKNDTQNFKIFTPLGRQAKIELSDGTKIWLNAGSTIVFPSLFAHDFRKIHIKGEAYIQVRHNDSIPFITEVNNHFAIEDVGTSFNISAYDTEQENVTLIDGLIKIENKNLFPSDQWSRNNNGLVSIHKIENAMDEVMWTKGFLNFNGMDYPSLLRKIGRWYNIKVSTIGELPNLHISGNIPNNMPLTNLLKILNSYGMKFDFKNNTLFVSKN